MKGDDRLERYRLNAEKCLELAQRFNDYERRRILIGMANAWLRQNSTSRTETALVYETPKPPLKARIERGDRLYMYDRDRDYYYHRHRGVEFHGPGFEVDVGR
jgi:hypothetical protein